MRKRPDNPGKGRDERSKKGAAELGAQKKARGEAQKARQRTRQHDMNRPDRGGPQGKKDKDFQRKF
jgi:hypothetical protein